MQSEKLVFTLAQIDFLFRALDRNNDGQIDEEEWKYKIFDDFQNPLSLLRDVISVNEISGEELLHKMKLKYSDEPLEYIKFQKCFKSIDSSINSLQTRAMFEELKNK